MSLDCFVLLLFEWETGASGCASPPPHKLPILRKKRVPAAPATPTTAATVPAVAALKPRLPEPDEFTLGSAALAAKPREVEVDDAAEAEVVVLLKLLLLLDTETRGRDENSTLCKPSTAALAARAAATARVLTSDSDDEVITPLLAPWTKKRREGDVANDSLEQKHKPLSFVEATQRDGRR